MLLRLIGKWLNAGVLESGSISRPGIGSPRGGVISPLLANVYLHEVFDTWFDREIQPQIRGRAYPIRYADDIAIVFSNEQDARQVLELLPKRFGRYGLTLHPEKTRLVDFRAPGPGRSPGSFDLLGFTHFWEKSRKKQWVVKRKTASSRFTRSLHAIRLWCRANLHVPLADQHHILCQKLRGHNAYFGITGNARALARFRDEAKRIWVKWLRRRSQRARKDWAWFDRLMARYPLPRPVAVHSVLRHAANPP